jgi:hypothetical protein
VSVTDGGKVGEYVGRSDLAGGRGVSEAGGIALALCVAGIGERDGLTVDEAEIDRDRLGEGDLEPEMVLDSNGVLDFNGVLE